ncbi:MAG: hypothetical protein V1835_06195 [Candidatus Micrarchaeota archaeon]
MVPRMRNSALFAIIAFVLLFQPASADCLYMKNKNGFPYGIIPTPGNITVEFTQPVQKNATFLLYIESEAGTSTSIECRVSLEVFNGTDPLKIELSNYSLETGAALIERPITVIMTPSNLVNFPAQIRAQIKITDIDYPSNYAILPINAKFNFERQKPKPCPTPVVSAQGPDSGLLFVTPSPKGSGGINTSGLNDLISGVEDSTSKYIIAIIAFFFLAAILWVGFNSLQRD